MSIAASEIQPRGAPRCPECDEPMNYYGGSVGYIHCDWKMLYRSGGWFDDSDYHVKDDRLAGGNRRVGGIVRRRPSWMKS